MKMNVWGRGCALLLVCFLMVSCSQPQNIYTPQGYLTQTGQLSLLGVTTGAAVGGYSGGGVFGTTIGAIAGGLIGTTIGYFLEKNQTIFGRVRDQGAQVIIVGHNILIIIPSDKFFYPDSPNRIHINDFLLDDIARLIYPYEKITVKISAYTDNTCFPDRAKALTEQQAQAIADYLWQTGIDTRILYGQGYGSEDPIATNTTPEGRARNRRIQITLRVLPGCCILTPGSGGS